MTPLDAPIVAVAVYADRARITRRASVELVAGEQTLTLAGVPASLIADSVRVAGRGAGVRVLGVDVDTEYVTSAPEANVAALTAQLETLQDQEAALRDEDAALAARLEHLAKLRASSAEQLPKGLAYGRTDVAALVALEDYVQREQSQIGARRRELATARRALNRELEAARARLNEVRHRQPQERRALQLVVEAAEPTEASFDLSYMAFGASWQPSYDVRLEGEAVRLTYLASVTQQTGEDWPAAELTLSTARPGVSGTIPELNPWYLDVFRPMPRPMAAPLMRKRMAEETFGEAADAAGGAPEMMMAMAAPAPMPAAAIAEATVQTDGAAVSYRVGRPVAVPSDGSPHRTQVTTVDLPAKLDYVTAPKLGEEAYLRAKVTNASKLVLLPGSASIFHGEEYVGVTGLATIAPTEEFEAQLGVDERVKVKRELTGRNVAKTLIGNVRRTTLSYKTTVTSLLPHAITVTVLDQIPHSRSEEIKVRLDAASPRPTEQTDLGVLRWELTLQPNQSVELTLGFTVEHQRELNVTGLGV